MALKVIISKSVVKPLFYLKKGKFGCMRLKKIFDKKVCGLI